MGVGDEGTGGWSGRCTSCNYDIKDGESMLDCLRRMESDRTF